MKLIDIFNTYPVVDNDDSIQLSDIVSLEKQGIDNLIAAAVDRNIIVFDFKVESWTSPELYRLMHKVQREDIGMSLDIIFVPYLVCGGWTLPYYLEEIPREDYEHLKDAYFRCGGSLPAGKTELILGITYHKDNFLNPCRGNKQGIATKSNKFLLLGAF